MYHCNICNQVFPKKYELDRHKKTTDGCRNALNLFNFEKSNISILICKMCNKEYKRLKYYQNHIEKCIEKKVINNVEKKVINNIEKKL